MGEDKKLGLFTLTALVVGSMIGGGAFNLASDMAKGAGAGAIIIGWVITGIGMIALGLSFQNLTVKRPDLDGGIFSYAKAGVWLILWGLIVRGDTGYLLGLGM